MERRSGLFSTDSDETLNTLIATAEKYQTDPDRLVDFWKILLKYAYKERDERVDDQLRQWATKGG